MMFKMHCVWSPTVVGDINSAERDVYTAQHGDAASVTRWVG